MNNYDEKQLFGSWKIKKLLGAGSYGKVYELENCSGESCEMYTALKVISIPEDEEDFSQAVKTFGGQDQAKKYFAEVKDNVINEVKLLFKLGNFTNIVGYINHAVVPHENGYGWDILLQMELLQSLRDYYLQRKHISTQDVIQLGIDMCSALEKCQKFNVVHRDIKPDNIMIAESGDYKLGDFGVSCILQSDRTRKMSKKGTEYYIAPELLYPDRESDSRVDIYSLGIVLYKLLNANRYPLVPRYPQEYDIISAEEDAFRRRISGEKLPPPQYAEGTRLGEIVLKACQADPAKRYFSPREMREDLQDIQLSCEERILFEVHREGAEITYHPTNLQPKKVNLIIKGNSSSFQYDGTEKTVCGFTTNADNEISVSLLTDSKAEARGTEPGKYPMDLKKEYFHIESLNPMVRVQCVQVEDGVLEITHVNHKRSNHKLLAAVIAAAAVVATGVFLTVTRPNPAELTAVPEVTQAETQVTEPVVTTEEQIPETTEVMLELKFIPNPNASYAEAKEDAEKLMSRINKLADGRAALIEQKDAEVTVKLPQRVIGKNSNIEHILANAVAEPLHLFFVKLDSLGNVRCFNSNELTRDMIQSVETVTARDLHESYNMPYELSGMVGDPCVINENQKFVKLVLTPEGAELQKSLEGETGNLSIGTDISKRTGRALPCMYAAEDGLTFALTNPEWDQEEQQQIFDAIAEAYREEPMHTNYYYKASMNPSTVWQETEQLSDSGQYQVDPDEIKGDQIRLKLHSFRRDDVSEQDLNMHIYNMKKRLDFLEVPYAIGLSTHYDQQINVLTSTDKLFPDLMPLLGEENLGFSTQAGRVQTWELNAEKAEVVQNENGSYGVKVTFDNLEALQAVARAMNQLSDQTMVIMGVETVPIMSCKVTYIPREPFLVFDVLPLLQLDQVQEDNKYILDLVAEHINVGADWPYESPQIFALDMGGSMKYSTRNIKYGKSVLSERENEICRILETEYPDVKYEVIEDIGGTRLFVKFDTEIKEHFIVDCIDLTEDIYKRCDMDDSIFDNIIFSFIKEENENRCRIGFSTKFRDKTIKSAIGMCYGGLLDGYAGEFEKYASGKYFYQIRDFFMYGK